jgi:hypothetical protein
MESIGPSVIRTVSALIVGWLLSLPIQNWLDISADKWEMLVTAVVSAVYYAVVRYLETHVSPKFSFLLASNKQPGTYVESARVSRP